jgi:RNA polymerase sigma-70 factor (ECF subfamily)
MASCCETKSTNAASASRVEELAGMRDRFLAFIARRVRSRELAEEILQDAYVRGMTRADSVRDDESVTAWFYRLLRNAIVDRQRRQGVEERSLERVAAETDGTVPPVDEELMASVCGCVAALVPTLKPTYASALQRVDLEGATVGAYAEEAAITANNARVRLHRAREALRQSVMDTCGACAEDGCTDCSCGH